jgi:hypothetical protein
MAGLKFMTDYHNLFDVQAFLNTFWKVPVEWNENISEIPFLLKEHHKFWSMFESYQGLNVLEFGGGPAMANLISAAKVAKSITFADYTQSNRNAVNSWINNETRAHDWSSMIGYVLNHLEGDNNEKAIFMRTHEMRTKIQPAVPCDITKYPIVNGEPYDVVSTSFCIEECSSSVDDYRKNIGKLCEIIAPGGYLHMAGNFNESFYVVGKHTFHVLPLEESIVLEAIKTAGMVVTNFEMKQMQESLDASNSRAVFSISSKKKQNIEIF